MSQVFELAAFTVREGHQHALLAERNGMITALGCAFPGLMSAWLTQRDDGSWLDVILWRGRAQAEHAAVHVTEVPEAAAWFTHIDQSRGIEHLEVRSPNELQRLLIPPGHQPYRRGGHPAPARDGGA